MNNSPRKRKRISTTRQLFGFSYTKAEQERMAEAQLQAIAMFSKYGIGRVPYAGSELILDKRAYSCDSRIIVPEKVVKPPLREIPEHPKYCPHCKRMLPSTSFYRRTSSEDGLQTWCKMCIKVAQYNARHRYG
jgi:hypothetical protein